MKQNTAIAALVCGLIAFLAGFGGIVGTLKGWSELVQPATVAQLCIMLSGVVGAVAAALNISLPSKG
jgi:hypothetical protein